MFGALFGYVSKTRFDAANHAFELHTHNIEARGAAFETILSLSSAGGFFHGARNYLIRPNRALYDKLMDQYPRFVAALKQLSESKLAPDVATYVDRLSLSLDEHLVMVERKRAGIDENFDTHNDDNIGEAIRAITLSNRMDRMELVESSERVLLVNRGVYWYALLLVFMVLMLSYTVVSFSRRAGKIYNDLDAANARIADANSKLEDRVRSRTRQLRRLNNDLGEQERLLRSTVDALPIAVAYIDGDMTFRRVSKGYEGWTGRAPSAVVGKHVNEVMGRTNMQRVGPLMQRALAGENISEDVEFTKGGSDFKIMHVDYIPDVDDRGVVMGIHMAFQDVTRQKNAEKAMVQATEDAIRASNSKSHFLAQMSHELRTPLNAVIGFSEAMKLQIFGSLNERYQGYSENIHKSAQHLLSLINDLLDLSKVEAGKMELQASDIEMLPVMDEVETFLKPLATSKGITLDFTHGVDLGILHVDRRAMLQSVMNIVSNAVKYTPNDGNVDVETGYDDDGAALIVVKDTGCGLSEDEIERVTKPFARGRRAVSSATEGTGLGLSLAIAMVKEHDGEVVIESTPGVGTKVTIRIPASRVVERGGQTLMGHKNTRTDRGQIIKDMFEED